LLFLIGTFLLFPYRCKLIPMRSQLLRFATILIVLFAAASACSLDGEQNFAHLGACKLASGQQIDQCRLGYRTWGTLNAQRSNAILVSTWFTGHSSELGDLVGADAVIDPAKYFLIAVDALGNGLSSSPSNSTTQHGPAFPAFTTRDMVSAEYRLVTETLHLTRLHAVMGISMGDADLRVDGELPRLHG
jgi:homoserine O-acetyltransferase/O-succinyltransferase